MTSLRDYFPSQSKKTLPSQSRFWEPPIMYTIRFKFLFCLALLLILVFVLALGGYSALSSYLNVVKDIEGRLAVLSASVEITTELKGLNEFSENVKKRYQSLFSLTILSGITSLILLTALVRLGYVWIFRPLSIVIDGSRIIASGRFQHRIKLNTQDEMSELAKTMNEMTSRFQTICADLDRQIRIRSQEAVRNERLASVGFLAAGVAHEINNPLASIAMCSESLENRLEPLFRERKITGHEEDIVHKYLKMIQTEAFRCKTITEKLLDFARTEKSNREKTDLSALIYGMVEMLAHHGDYRDKEVCLSLPESLYATVNPQEMKQVVLNLLTNSLDSIPQGGVVRVKLYEKLGIVHLIVEDNGCGMDAEVLQNVFEPFFTRKKQGQGTGLGLSITHRIISDHDGRIEASSGGIGKGSTFRIEIPFKESGPKEQGSIPVPG